MKWEMTLRMLIRWLDCSLRMCWGEGPMLQRSSAVVVFADRIGWDIA